MGHEISLLPEALPDDVEDVTWALSTAAALWGRGELKEALVWVRRAAEAAGAAGHDGRAVALARNAVALEGWMAAPTSPEKRPEEREPKSAAARSVVPSVPPPKPPLPRAATEKLPEIEPEFLEEETNDLRSVPVVAAISSAEAASTAAPSPLVQTVLSQGASTPAAPKSPSPEQSAQLSKLGALANEPVRPAARRPTLDGPGPLAPTHPAPAPAARGPALAAGASPSSTLSPPAAALAASPSSVASITPSSQTSDIHSPHEPLASTQEQAAREERRAQKKRQRAPILDPWSDELPPSDPPPRTVQQRPELLGADDADVLTSAPSLDVTLKRKPPPPPPKRSGTLTGTVLAPVPESPESRRASALAAAQEEAAVTPPPSAISITAPGTNGGEAPSVSARPPPPRRPTLQPRAASGPQSERKSLPPPPPLPRIVAEDRADGAPPTMPAAQRKITVQPRVQEDAGPSSAAAAPARPALAAPVDVTPAPGAAATVAASASPDPALVSKLASIPPPAPTARTVAAEPSAVPDAIPPAAATLPMALPGPAEANSASALDDLTPIAPEVGQLAERERRVSDLPPKPKSDLPPRPKSEPPPRPKSDLPPVGNSAQLARSLNDTLKTGVRTFRLGGIALESVEPFRALSDAGLRLLREKATVTELGAEEEVGATGAVLLLEGSAVICAAVSDAAAHHLLPGTLASCTPTRSDATKIRVVGVAPSKLAAWDRATLEAAVSGASTVREDLTRLGDRHAALAGSTMGPLGDLDESSRLAAFERMSSRTVAPGEVFVPAGGELAGLTVVGSGALIHEDGREFGAGDVLLAELALESKPLSGALTAGEDGAVVLSATRMGTVELFSIIPTLLELLRPA